MLIERDYPLPLYLGFRENITDEDLFDFCATNKHLRIERNENKELIAMAPAGRETGNQHSELNFAIQLWNKQTNTGKTFDSSTGFSLPDGSMRSPDVSWITNENGPPLPQNKNSAFFRLHPIFW